MPSSVVLTMPGYRPASISFFSSSPFGPPAMLTSVGTQSSEANISVLTVPGSIWPGQRTTIGARMPPSQVRQLAALERRGAAVGEGDRLGAVVGGEDDDGVVELTHVLELVRTTPMLSSICFMPASLTPQSLPPGSPTMARYLSDSTVVMCMRAGLYQTKNGLLVVFGSLRSRKSTTLAEISSSTVFDRSSVSGPSSLQLWFAAAAVFGLAPEHRPRRRQADRGLGIDRAGDLRQAGDRRVLARRRDASARSGSC